MPATERQLRQELDKHRRQIDVENFDVTLRELVRMSATGELRRAPEYQRKFRWTEADESYLVESLFLGLPVPTIFVASNTDGSWEVVDGLQRLSSLIHFMSEDSEHIAPLGRVGNLTLAGLAKLSSFNGLSFFEMPTPLQLHFSKRSLRVTALSDKSDPEIRFEVFERLNKGGVVLTPQEVRACIHRGPFAELLRDLADTDDFHALVKLQKLHSNDGTREELVLKFFAYLEKGDRFDGRVKEFLNQYMREVADTFDLAAGRELFTLVVQRLLALVDGPFLRSKYGNTPLNQLEAVMVAVGRLIRAGKRIRQPPGAWLDDPELVRYSTKGTNTRKAFHGRNKRAEVLLSGKK